MSALSIEKRRRRRTYYLHAALLPLCRRLRSLRLCRQRPDVGLHEPVGEDREASCRVHRRELLERLPRSRLYVSLIMRTGEESKNILQYRKKAHLQQVVELPDDLLILVPSSPALLVPLGALDAYPAKALTKVCVLH